MYAEVKDNNLTVKSKLSVNCTIFSVELLVS